MENKLINKMSKKYEYSIDELHKFWEDIENDAIGIESNKSVYISGMFKRLLGEKLTFAEFMIIVEEGVPTNSTGSVVGSHEPTDGKPNIKKDIIKRHKKKRKFLTIEKG